MLNKAINYISHLKVSRLREDWKKMQRVKLRLAENSVYLLEDFMAAAVRPASIAQPYFKQIFGEGGNKIVMGIIKADIQGHITVYKIPAQVVHDCRQSENRGGEEPVPASPFEALSLSDLVSVMDKTQTSLLGAINIYELGSMVRGQGHHVAQFWEAVANLKDYGSFVPPDQEPPKNDRGGLPDKDRVVRTGRWIPAGHGL